MGHIELRDLSDVDVGLVPPRSAVGEWTERQSGAPDATVWVVTDDGRLAGAAAAFTSDDEREVTYRLIDDDPALAAETLRLLVSLEPERPLYARLPVGDDASAAMLARLGFTEESRTDAETRFVLPPTLE